VSARLLKRAVAIQIRYRIDSICWAMFAIFFFANQPRRCDPAAIKDSRNGTRVPKGQLKTGLRFR
jgi:hypothetical protein